jgi:hypothetical protein
MQKEAPQNEASYFSHGLLAAVSPKSDQVYDERTSAFRLQLIRSPGFHQPARMTRLSRIQPKLRLTAGPLFALKATAAAQVVAGRFGSGPINVQYNSKKGGSATIEPLAMSLQAAANGMDVHEVYPRPLVDGPRRWRRRHEQARSRCCLKRIITAAPADAKKLIHRPA